MQSAPGVHLETRPEGYDPIKVRNLEPDIVKALAESGNNCYDSILRNDVVGLGRAMTQTFLSCRKMLPYTVPDWVLEEMENKYLNNFPGTITFGSGGGYAVVASETMIEGAIKIKVKF